MAAAWRQVHIRRGADETLSSFQVHQAQSLSDALDSKLQRLSRSGCLCG